MRRLVRLTGTLLALAGLALLAWAFTVWRWEDPVTSLYTHLEQRNLARGYDEVAAGYAVAPTATAGGKLDVPAAAKAYRKALRPGGPVGRLRIPKLGITTMVVEGTDDETLKRGPGRYRQLYLPGEGELVYLAGHRTTYSAPFSRIDELRPGDEVVLEVPYARFVYRVVRHRIVADTEVSVLKSGGEELLALQACHPRFFATHRYIAYAKPVRVEPRVTAKPDATAVPAG
ncbi:MAG TPA: class E sortase [Gaiellaceae bacterium]|nr:class E sortase [Gaiellaceae bacterium]